MSSIKHYYNLARSNICAGSTFDEASKELLDKAFSADGAINVVGELFDRVTGDPTVALYAQLLPEEIAAIERIKTNFAGCK